LPICFFCQKRDAGVGDEVKVKLYKGAASDASDNTTVGGCKLDSSEKTVQVPRCLRCRSMHNARDRISVVFSLVIGLLWILFFFFNDTRGITKVLILSGGLGWVLIFYLIGFIIGYVIGFYIGKWITDKSIKSVGDVDSYPEVATALANGYKKTKKKEKQNAVEPLDRLSVRMKELDSSICYFCQKRDAKAGNAVKVKLYKGAASDCLTVGKKKIRSKFHYLEKTINVPRCSKCRSTHLIRDMSAGVFAVAVGLPWFLFFFLRSNGIVGWGNFSWLSWLSWGAILGNIFYFIGFIIGYIFGLIIGNKITDKNIRTIDVKNDYPEVAAAFVDGYTKDKEKARQQVKEQENLISL